MDEGGEGKGVGLSWRGSLDSFDREGVIPDEDLGFPRPAVDSIRDPKLRQRAERYWIRGEELRRN